MKVRMLRNTFGENGEPLVQGESYEMSDNGAKNFISLKKAEVWAKKSKAKTKAKGSDPDLDLDPDPNKDPDETQPAE